MDYPTTHLRGTVALNRIRLDLDRAANPDADQRAWLEQIEELQALSDSSPNGGQLSADSCPRALQVSAAATGIRPVSLEKGVKVSGFERR